MSADERKRRRGVTQQARRVRQRELSAAAETARTQDGLLTDEQQRALEARNRKQVRDGTRDRTGGRTKRRRTTTANENEEAEEPAVAAAAIVHLVD